MPILGNQITTQAFPFDQFSGNGTLTAFTLTYAPAGTTSVIVAVSGVVQNPNTYSIVGTTITFTEAVPAGTNNIAVLYLGIPVIAATNPGNTAFYTDQEFLATQNQTVFTVSTAYTPGFVDVWRNGVKLGANDITATNGTTVTLGATTNANDIITIRGWTLTTVSNAVPATGGSFTGNVGMVSVNTGAPVSNNLFMNSFLDVKQRINRDAKAYLYDRWFQSSGVTNPAWTADKQFDNCFQLNTSGDYYGQCVARMDVRRSWKTAKTYTFSVFADIATAGNITITFDYPSAQDNYTGSTRFITDTFAVPTGTQRITRSYTMHDNCYVSTGGIRFALASAGAIGKFAGTKLEPGSNATPMEYWLIGNEMPGLLRYYEKSYMIDTAPGTNTGGSNGVEDMSLTPIGSAAPARVRFSTRKRITNPVVTIYDPAGNAGKISSDGGATNNQNYSNLDNISDIGFKLWVANSYQRATFHWTAEAEIS